PEPRMPRPGHRAREGWTREPARRRVRAPKRAFRRRARQAAIEPPWSGRGDRFERRGKRKLSPPPCLQLGLDGSHGRRGLLVLADDIDELGRLNRTRLLIDALELRNLVGRDGAEVAELASGRQHARL